MSAITTGPDRDPSLPDPAAPLTASGNLRRRLFVSRLVDGGSVAAAVIAVAILGIVIYGVASRGASVLSFSFLFTLPTSPTTGGIVNYLVGTGLIVAMATAIALPVGILCGLYLSELVGPRSRTGRALTFVLDLTQGLPTIVVGLFVFGFMVNHHGDSGFAGSVALSIVMLPLIARSSQEMLSIVPGALREAADSLGVARWRTVVGVILPTAMGGILTGAILAIARCAGETAPLLITDEIFNPNSTQVNIFGHGVPNIAMLIYSNANSGVPQALPRAWGAAIALLLVILVSNIGARILLARSRARMSGS
jgi:phosphate transport system permease protein